jgi:hypothetical protein
MGARPTYDVDAWDVALTLLRHIDPEAVVTVPKTAEPTLPPEPSFRRSNVPWSIHKGAHRVYREDCPGSHLQVREYGDHWTVERDQHNPHYRPVRHVLTDTAAYRGRAVTHPVETTVGLLAFGPVRTAQFLGQVATTAALTPVTTLDRLVSTAVTMTDGDRY